MSHQSVNKASLKAATMNDLSHNYVDLLAQSTLIISAAKHYTSKPITVPVCSHHYLGTKSIFLMKVATKKFAVFSCGDNAFSLNANAAWPTLYLTCHMIISLAAIY